MSNVNLPALPVLDTVFDTLPSGLILYAPNGDIFRINKRGKFLLGLADDIVLDNLQNFPAYLNPLKLLLVDAHKDIHRAEVKLHLPAWPDEEATIGFSLTILEASNQKIITCTFSDITQVLRDRLSMEKIKDELAQSKKLASIGTMISGVAHELNNPLTGISMSAELSRMNLERLQKNPDLALIEKTLGEIEKISRSCQKASQLVDELMSYSRPTQLKTEIVPIDSLVEEVVTATKSHPSFSQYSMSVEKPEFDQPLPVRVDRVKLEQVFYNLLKNACDACPHGSLHVFYTLTLSPQDHHLPAIAIHFQDNGPGIDKTVLNRIFDPFFSTKGNKGLGLGLSITYRTVEQHGGLLSVDSTSGEGATFTVTLPLYNEKEDFPT